MYTVESKRGFSLVELMIVIAMIGIIAAIAAPSYQSYTRKTNFKSAVRELTSDLFQAKEMGISENRNFRISFTVDGSTYSIQRETSTAGTYETVRTRDISSGVNVKITGAAFGGKSHIEFQPRGTCTSGSVTLANDQWTATINLNNTGRTYVTYAP
jgi:type II secretion system protein H